MKKFKIFVSLLMVFVLIGCGGGVERPPEIMPDDFYFILKINGSTVLDTKNNIIGSNTVEGYVYTDFYITNEDLMKIYNVFVEHEIFLLNRPYRHVYSGRGYSNEIYYDLIFHLNGREYTILFEFSTILYAYIPNNQMGNLWAFYRMLEEFLIGTEEFQTFPKPRQNWN